MPYDKERANAYGYSSILDNKFINSRLTTFTSRNDEENDKLYEYIPTIDAKELDSTISGKGISHLIGIDGSVITVSLEKPSVEVGFLKMGTVLTNLSRLEKLNQERFVDAKELDDCFKTYSVESILPGHGIIDRNNRQSTIDKYRLEVFENLKQLQVDPQRIFKTFSDDFSLLDIFKTLKEKSSLTTITCPHCKTFNIKVNIVPIKCPECFTIVYYSDLLQLHEKFSGEQSNAASYTEAMSTFERLLMAGLLWKANKKPESFTKTAFITDGPLAFFLSKNISSDMLRFYQSLNQTPILFGLEKTGKFADFANYPETQKYLKPGHLFMITNDVLQKILGKNNDNYGVQAFYGRRFLYRTVNSNKTFVINVPPISGIPYGDFDDSADEWEQYPTLFAICEIIERDKTNMFGVNTPSITTIAKANETASIPQKLGGVLLKELLERQNFQSEE